MNVLLTNVLECSEVIRGLSNGLIVIIPLEPS